MSTRATNQEMTMTSLTRRDVAVGSALAATVLAVASPDAHANQKPPAIAAPAGARSVTVTLRLKAKDASAFKAHLLKVIPVTRVAAGCRFSHTFQDPAKSAEFVLIQGWDSLEQQQGYIKWREQTGDLKQFVDMLVQPPVVEVFELIDA
jgi:quinol monooxygenase YgiN